METAVRRRKRSFLLPILLFAALLLLLFLLVFFLKSRASESAPPAPVTVNDGANEVSITPYPTVPVSPFSPEDFSTNDGISTYTGSDYIALQGIDVSEFQSPIDWTAVKADGIDFVIIRCGGRTYKNGTLYDDEAFTQNINGALDAGLKVGVYFFSQAINTYEAKEEAESALSLLDGAPITLPIFWDWECPADDCARTLSVDWSTLTAMAKSFCQIIADSGYVPGIYFNRQLGYYAYDWTQLTDCVKWISDPSDWPDFYYAVAFWQYNFNGSIDGISIQTDRNLMFIPK